MSETESGRMEVQIYPGDKIAELWLDGKRIEPLDAPTARRLAEAWNWLGVMEPVLGISDPAVVFAALVEVAEEVLQWEKVIKVKSLADQARAALAKAGKGEA